MKNILFFLSILSIMLSGCNANSTSTPKITETIENKVVIITPTPEVSKTQFLTITPVPISTTTFLPPDDIQDGQIKVNCNNLISDAAIINTAISGSAEGDEIVISGPCLINQTIKLLGNRSYRGTSRTGTILKQANNANLIALLATDTYLDNQEWTGTPVSIRQMTLDGNSDMNQQVQTDGIILRSWFSVIEEMLIIDMSGNGLRLTNKSANGTELVTSQVNGNISDNFFDRSGQYAIFVEDSQNAVTDWTLIDNWIAFSGVDGIHLENAAGWTIERNHIYGVPQNAIYAHRLWGTSISNNYIEGFGETEQTGNWYGIYATLQGGIASTISNNRIFNLSGKNNPTSNYQYLVATVNNEIGMVSINGNAIRGVNLPNEIGLYYSGGESHKLVVTSFGNLVENMNTERITSGDVVLSDGY